MEGAGGAQVRTHTKHETSTSMEQQNNILRSLQLNIIHHSILSNNLNHQLNPSVSLLKMFRRYKASMPSKNRTSKLT